MECRKWILNKKGVHDPFIERIRRGRIPNLFSRVYPLPKNGRHFGLLSLLPYCRGGKVPWSKVSSLFYYSLKSERPFAINGIKAIVPMPFETREDFIESLWRIRRSIHSSPYKLSP